MERAVAPPRLVVLTGGARTGKTTVVERLASLGFTTCDEAAREVQWLIRNDVALVGGGKAQRWRNPDVQRKMVVDFALEQEEKALARLRAGEHAFLDRS